MHQELEDQFFQRLKHKYGQLGRGRMKMAINMHFTTKKVMQWLQFCTLHLISDQTSLEVRSFKYYTILKALPGRNQMY